MNARPEHKNDTIQQQWRGSSRVDVTSSSLLASIEFVQWGLRYFRVTAYIVSFIFPLFAQSAGH
jgi:hypothetical protein